MSKLNKAIFLDRDGVINDLIFYSEEGVLDSPNLVKQFKISKGTIKALNQLKKLGYLLILISNQPGVAKGKYTIAEFHKIKKKMEDTLSRGGPNFDAQYYCMHHPNAVKKEFKKNCQCRKPKTKMIRDGIEKFYIDLKKSFVIGDGIVDMEMAKKANCRGIFIGNINSSITKLFHEKKVEPFFVAHDLLDATKFLYKIENTPSLFSHSY